MDAGDIHAIAMLSLIPIAAGIVWGLRKLSRSNGGPKNGGLQALLAFVLIFVVITGVGPAYVHGPKHVAFMQVLIPALVAGIMAAFIVNRWIRWSLNVAVIVVASYFAGDFLSLVTNKERCEYTGHTKQYVSGSCNGPADAVDLWHSSFTLLYGLRRK